jgi:bisphosphoglycerate-independent phosphoglycerate mutase (AlkP superfamily)
LFFEGDTAVKNYQNLLTQLITLLEEKEGHYFTPQKNIQTQNFSTLTTKPTKLSMYLSYLPSFLKNRDGDKVSF